MPEGGPDLTRDEALAHEDLRWIWAASDRHHAPRPARAVDAPLGARDADLHQRARVLAGGARPARDARGGARPLGDDRREPTRPRTAGSITCTTPSTRTRRCSTCSTSGRGRRRCADAGRGRLGAPPDVRAGAPADRRARPAGALRGDQPRACARPRRATISPGHGNRFWATLHAAGFTPRRLAPGGGRAAALVRARPGEPVDRPDARGLGARARGAGRRAAPCSSAPSARYAPRLVAMVGVTAYRVAFGRAEARRWASSPSRWAAARSGSCRTLRPERPLHARGLRPRLRRGARPRRVAVGLTAPCAVYPTPTPGGVSRLPRWPSIRSSPASPTWRSSTSSAGPATRPQIVAAVAGQLGLAPGALRRRRRRGHGQADPRAARGGPRRRRRGAARGLRERLVRELPGRRGGRRRRGGAAVARTPRSTPSSARTPSTGSTRRAPSPSSPG